MSLITAILTLGGILVAAWAVLRFVILVELRVDQNTFRTLYETLDDGSKFVIEEEFFTESRHPVVYRVFCKYDKVPIFYLAHQERMLHAGFQGKDFITVIICFRWSYKALKSFLSNQLRSVQLEKFGIPVLVATPWHTDKIGSIKDANVPLIEKSLWMDIEDDVADVMNGKKSKTGAILYGKPGNGKTSLVRHLAVKHKVPIVIITFSPEFTNLDIMFMFSNVPDRCIVLLEDFDNYFNCRRCIIGESLGGSNNMGIKFTFDSILNCLDGVYNSYDKVVFFLTANDISKVDMALRQRPSRFKFVRNFDNPDAVLRESIVGSWASSLDGVNLDQLLRIAEFKSHGDTLEQARQRLDISN